MHFGQFFECHAQGETVKIAPLGVFVEDGAAEGRRIVVVIGVLVERTDGTRCEDRVGGILAADTAGGGALFGALRRADCAFAQQAFARRAL